MFALRNPKNMSSYLVGTPIRHGTLNKTATYIGEQGDDLPLKLCHPKLGGQFQTKVDIWISEPTKVSIK